MLFSLFHSVHVSLLSSSLFSLLPLSLSPFLWGGHLGGHSIPRVEAVVLGKALSKSRAVASVHTLSFFLAPIVSPCYTPSLSLSLSFFFRGDITPSALAKLLR